MISFTLYISALLHYISHVCGVWCDVAHWLTDWHTCTHLSIQLLPTWLGVEAHTVGLSCPCTVVHTVDDLD